MNNKFKRFNKILMMTVAILLCFVLISTSVVSGIFAKYVITRSAGATVSLKKFGVKLSMYKGADFAESGASASISDDGTTITTSITGIGLVPGKDYPDIVKFTAAVDGTVSVNTRIKVKAVVDTTDGTTAGNKFKLDSTTYIPIATRIKIGSAAAQDVASAWEAASFSDYQTKLTAGLRNKIGTSVATNDTAYAGAKIATAGATQLDANAKSTISFGFCVPATYGTGDAIATYDERITKIAANQPSFTITFYVSLEQIV